MNTRSDLLFLVAVIALVVAVLTGLGKIHQSELRDLQRRIAVLEQGR